MYPRRRALSKAEEMILKEPLTVAADNPFFSSEERHCRRSAGPMAARLSRARFPIEDKKEVVNGAYFWVVLVFFAPSLSFNQSAKKSLTVAKCIGSPVAASRISLSTLRVCTSVMVPERPAMAAFSH